MFEQMYFGAIEMLAVVFAIILAFILIWGYFTVSYEKKRKYNEANFHVPLEP